MRWDLQNWLWKQSIILWDIFERNQQTFSLEALPTNGFPLCPSCPQFGKTRNLLSIRWNNSWKQIVMWFSNRIVGFTRILRKKMVRVNSCNFHTVVLPWDNFFMNGGRVHWVQMVPGAIQYSKGYLYKHEYWAHTG